MDIDVDACDAKQRFTNTSVMSERLPAAQIRPNAKEKLWNHLQAKSNDKEGISDNINRT